jgi:hypothetical protein
MPKENSDYCPICGEFMDVLCSGHRSKPFVDGRKYDAICFVCFNVPKTWYVKLGKAEDGSEDVWEGPFFDWKHLNTAEELVSDGSTDDLKRARKSVKAVKAQIKKMTAKQKQEQLLLRKGAA